MKAMQTLADKQQGGIGFEDLLLIDEFPLRDDCGFRPR
jgi:hypothetical protein